MMMKPSIETSYPVPESQALLALIAPDEHADSLRRGSGALVVDSVSDSWAESGDAVIAGHIEDAGVSYPTSISIHFPGFLMRSIARICNNEPTAMVSLTVLEPEVNPSRLHEQ